RGLLESPPAMKATPVTAPTLNALMEANRSVDRSVVYLEGEQETRKVPFAQLYERALGILYRLQRLGAQPGDKLILFLAHNEPFMEPRGGAGLGGIPRVPTAPGIPDDPRHKLLRIARKLRTPFIFTEQRLFDRIGQFAAEQGEAALFETLRGRALQVEELE